MVRFLLVAVVSGILTRLDFDTAHSYKLLCHFNSGSIENYMTFVTNDMKNVFFTHLMVSPTAANVIV